MKKIILSFCLLFGLATLIIVPTFASDNDTVIFQWLSGKLKHIPTDSDALLQIDDYTITVDEWERYKAYASATLMLNGLDQQPDERELLKRMIIDKLMLLEAEKMKLTVDLDTARQHAREMRAILAEADERTQSFQQKVIDLTGLSEEQYWEEHAPLQYQRVLTIEKLVEELLIREILPNSATDLAAHREAMDQYKQDLYEKYRANIKVLSKDVQLP